LVLAVVLSECSLLFAKIIRERRPRQAGVSIPGSTYAALEVRRARAFTLVFGPRIGAAGASVICAVVSASS